MSEELKTWKSPVFCPEELGGEFEKIAFVVLIMRTFAPCFKTIKSIQFKPIKDHYAPDGTIAYFEITYTDA